ncbi:hypothetical protein BH10PSE4_BH10PSE4_41180 [soil metagenome]
MRNFMLVAVGTALLASAPLAVSAQSGQQNGPPGDRRPPSSQPGPGMGQGDHARPGMGSDHNDRPGMAHDDHDNRYGRWDNGWGSRPPPPPKRYSRHGNWYQHVRACQTRYRSYNARTDTYVVRRGVVARCRL